MELRFGEEKDLAVWRAFGDEEVALGEVLGQDINERG